MPSKERIDRGKELVAVLELAAQYPARHNKDISNRFEDLSEGEKHDFEPTHVGNAVLKASARLDAMPRETKDNTQDNLDV